MNVHFDIWLAFWVYLNAVMQINRLNKFFSLWALMFFNPLRDELHMNDSDEDYL